LTVFTVEYGLNYKIATNLDAGTSYLLYQCGTPVPPSLNVSLYDHVLPIPLSEFGLQSSTFVPFIEILGLRSVQMFQEGSSDFFFSPCFTALIDSGEIKIFRDRTNLDEVNATGVSLDTPFFVGVGNGNPASFGPPSVFDINIEISEYRDLSNLAAFEWLKFFGVFFNRETEANAAFESARDRFLCVADNAAIILETTNRVKPKGVWGNYAGFGSGASWEGFYPATTCPNYYCQMADICGAELLLADSVPMNITEFVEFAKDADIWIYPSGGIETILNAYSTELEGVKAFQLDQVYDNQGHGEDAWFNDRKVEPDALLEDFCHVVGTSSPFFPHVPAFFRDLGTPEVLPGECTDPDSPYQFLGSFCEPLPPGGTPFPTAEPSTASTPETTNDPTTPPSLAVNVSVEGLALSLLLLFPTFF
jgi:iron complex transport system substrate-binding protein